MSLLNLPVELLTLINQSIIADDTAIRSFESLALTCHALYGVAQGLLETYKLTRDFRQFGFEKGIRSSRGREIRGPCELIYELATRPQVAEIIRFADIRWLERSPQHEQSLKDAFGPELESNRKEWDELRQMVRRVLVDSPYTAELNLDAEAWGAALCDADCNWKRGDTWDAETMWATALLLTMLPNVEMLAYSTSRHEEDNFDSDPWRLIKSLVRNANTTDSASCPLSKLREILPEYGAGYDTRTRWTFHQLFLGLKNLEVCTQGSVVAYNDGYTGVVLTLTMDFFPGLRELVLKDSIMGGDEIYELTSRMPKLEIFSLEQTVKWHGCGFTSWDPKAFVEKLAAAVGTHLRSLSIIIGNDDLGGTESMTDSFAGFTKLEELQFDLDLLEIRNELDNSVKPLHGRLSQSLRRLRLVGEEVIRQQRDSAWMDQLFADWNEHIDSTAPDLDVVEILNMRRLSRDEMFTALEAKTRQLQKVKLVGEAGWKLMTFGQEWPEWFEVYDE